MADCDAAMLHKYCIESPGIVLSFVLCMVFCIWRRSVLEIGAMNGIAQLAGVLGYSAIDQFVKTGLSTLKVLYS